MSIATEISRLQTAKADIKTAIEAKGVTVPSNATLDTYDTYVSQISGGGGTNYLSQYVNKSLSGAISSTQIGAITGDSSSSKVWNMSYFLEGNENITSLDLSDSTFTDLRGNYFCTYCTSLTSITLPTTCTKISGANFGNNTGLTSFTIPSQITQVGNNFLNSCANLISVTIPSTVTNMGTNLCVGSGIVSLKSGLQRLIFQANVTSIPNYTARYCTDLNYIDIASNITAINRYSFQSYSSNSTELVVVIRNTNAMVTLEYATNASQGPFRNRTNVKVYVPSSLKSTYQANSNWTASGGITFYDLEGSDYE